MTGSINPAATLTSWRFQHPPVCQQRGGGRRGREGGGDIQIYNWQERLKAPLRWKNGFTTEMTVWKDLIHHLWITYIHCLNVMNCGRLKCEGSGAVSAFWHILKLDLLGQQQAKLFVCLEVSTGREESLFGGLLTVSRCSTSEHTEARPMESHHGGVFIRLSRPP